MRTLEFDALIDLLSEHPEFSADQSNPCDAEIVAYGSYLWSKWLEQEKLELPDTTGDEEFTDPLQRELSVKTRDILQMVMDGKSSVEIRSKHGITAQQLTGIKSQYGLSATISGVRNARNTKHNFDDIQLLKDFQELQSVPALAAKYGIHPQSMRQYLKRKGIKLPRQSKAERLTVCDIKGACSEHRTMVATAKSLGVSVPTLLEALRINGTSWKELTHAA